MLQITLVFEDEEIRRTYSQEEIAEFEDYVQSSDVAAMQSFKMVFIITIENNKRFFRILTLHICSCVANAICF
jgi:EF-1 guanine nucleotide exchange domain